MAAYGASIGNAITSDVPAPDPLPWRPFRVPPRMP